ncbi:hypothetical protein [Clostridium perfringens]|uniref:Uncharacterized protein n=1 Tax=Clostridium perfringens TaxID=1502 RepID=A0AAN5NB00_CLOPF|nr:hypothetical protein [Clostridium perfringens]AQW26782.1 hypothetical protein BXT94_08390 [Clostridium perfringens]KAB8120582.1 hypothetical protein FVB38_05800 [Clostridium perfringens]KQC91154.1 hypothetical protein AM596_16185 [Clostridium perfringens CP4]MBO3435696.1 hypothetical protein [Clostridium perfringens]MDK0593147.1 hypothetical protein [Clostridium perfringens]
MVRKLYGGTLITSQEQQEIITPENIGLKEISLNSHLVKGFQIINDGDKTIEIQINNGSKIPLIQGSGIDMGNEWVNSCVVYTIGAKITWACQR